MIQTKVPEPDERHCPNCGRETWQAAYRVEAVVPATRSADLRFTWNCSECGKEVR